MCEYCGCQSLTAIDELTREHDHVVNLIGEVRAAHAAADTPRMVAAAGRIAAVLGPHTVVEEDGLFPALAEDFPDHVAALKAEHRRIEGVLAEAGTADARTADTQWPDRLIEVLDVLREHILKEQDGVFPAALTTLRGPDWAAVEAVRARVGSALPVGQP